MDSIRRFFTNFVRDSALVDCPALSSRSYTAVHIDGSDDSHSYARQGAYRELSRECAASSDKRIDFITEVGDLTNEIKSIRLSDTSGGFSDIYHGEWIRHDLNQDKKIAIQVAIKLFRGKTIERERLKKRLNCEINIWKRLRHPNIAEFFGISFQISGQPALVMRWYENSTAPHYIKHRQNVDVFGIILDSSIGLEYLHMLNPPVIHGDLKGSNILVSNTGRAVLSDFGLSKLIEEFPISTGNTTSSFSGTIRWQAPELFSDEESPSNPQVTRSSDMWSFGCTAYELLTGNFPYYKTPWWAVVNVVKQGVTPVMQDSDGLHSSPHILQILDECWHKSPDERPEISDIVHRWRSIHEARAGI